jgi:hypothetical protein
MIRFGVDGSSFRQNFGRGSAGLAGMQRHYKSYLWCDILFANSNKKYISMKLDHISINSN